MPKKLTFPLKSTHEYVIWEDRPDYHLLLFNIPPDNRFSPETCPAIIEAVTYIRTEGEPKPLITTSTSPKFYSNGLDFERAIVTPNFFTECYYPLMRVFLEFPWPTIALVNGHAFAAGFMVVECHDYQVMNPDKGFLCMNELMFGAPLKGALLSIFRERFGVQRTHKIVLTAHRYTSKEALEEGFITERGGLPEAEALAAKVAEYAKLPTYGQIRKELFRSVIEDLKTYDEYEAVSEKNGEYEDNFYDKIIENYKRRAKL